MRPSTIQRLLDARAARLTEAERVLQLHLQQPALPPAPRPWLLRIARLFTALFAAQTLLAGIPAYAQITAAPGAVAGQKPLIDAAANGTPIVLIAPPSRAGVSRNLYEQLNVGPKGLILNNATAPVQTQLGGWITGNLQLGQTPARIILNEVTGANASQLKGYIEVGGQKADLVIANPNGITCDGCGFLNANRATLTTGRPQLGFEGALTGLDVRQGVITVGPGGLDATEQQQLDIIARGLVAQGEVFTQKLQALIGANQVVYATLQAAPQTGTGDAPRFAIDIKDLGGMHAGQIYLIATDKGLGVNSTGRMSTLAGNLVLSADGELSLKDSYSAQDLVLSGTGKTTLTGQTLAQGRVQIDAPGQLTNSGALQAATLELNTPRIDNSGSMAQTAPGAELAWTLPGGLANSGAIYTPGNLSVTAASVTGGSTVNATGTTTGSLLAGGALTIAAATLDLRGQQLAADRDIHIQAHELRAVASAIQSGGKVSMEGTGAVDLTDTTVVAHSSARVTGHSIALERSKLAALGAVQLTSAGKFSANAAELASNAAIGVQAASISMSSGSLTAATTASLASAGDIRLDASVVTAGEQLSVTGQGVSMAAATVAAPRVAIDAGALALLNQGGKVLASSTGADALSVNAAGIDNQGGELRANGGLTLDARGGRIDNTQGVIAGASGTLVNLGGLTNRGGVIYTESDLSLSSTALDNSAGAIVTRGNLSVTTPGQAIENAAGLLQGAGTVTLEAGSAALNNAKGAVVAGGALSVRAGAVDTSGGTLAAGGPLDITATGLAGNGATLGSGAAMNINVAGHASLNAGTLDATGNLTVNAGAIEAAGATAKSNANTQVTADTITGGSWQAQGDVTATAQGALNLTGGGLLAVGNVWATGQGITTDNAQVSGQNVTLNAGAGTLSNQGGNVNAKATTGTALHVNAVGINNTGGTLASTAGAVINAGNQAVDNTGGTIQVDGNLLLTASQLVNRRGTINTGSSLTLQNFALDNNAGKIETRGDLTINTAGQAIDNTAGTLKADGHTSLTAGAILGNGGAISAGTTSTDGKLTVRATSMEASNARLSGSRELDILVTQRLAVANATLETQGKLTAGAAVIEAPGATLSAAQSLSVSANGALDLTGATVKVLGAQAQDIELTGSGITARGATINGDAAVTLISGGTLDVGDANVTAIKSLSLSGSQALGADGAGLTTNEALTVSGSSVAAAGASLSAGGHAQVTATAGAATLDSATLLAGDTARITATGIAASAAVIGAVGSVTLDAGTGDLAAPNVLVQSQNASISLTAAGVNAAGSTAAGATPTTGLLAAQAIAISAAGAVDVSRAATAAATSVTITTGGAIGNDGGRILAGTTLDLTGASLDNQGGLVDAHGAVNISVSAGQVVNDQGRISTRGVLTMTAPGGALTSVSNAGGIIDTAGAFDVQLQNFNNTGGSVTALAGLTIAGGAVTNTAGTLASKGNVSVNTQGGSFAGDRGSVLSTQGNVSLTTGAAALDDSSVKAQGDVTVIGTSVAGSNATFQANTGALSVSVGTGAAILTNTQLLSGQDFTLTAGNTGLNHASVTSGGNTSLTTGALQASQAVINSQGNFIANATGAVTADKAQIAAGGAARITATAGIALNNGSVNAQTVELKAGGGRLDNTAGKLVAAASTGTALKLQSQGLLNDGGTIASGAHLSVNAGAGHLANTGGAIVAVGAADIRSTGLTNTGGTIASNGALTVNAAQAHALAQTDNRRGTIRSAQASVHLTTGELVNSRIDTADAGSLIAGATSATVNAGGAVDNSRSEILARAGNLIINATGDVANDSGKLQASANLALTGGALTNSAGEISAQAGSATLAVTSYSNAAGSVLAGGALAIDTQGGSFTANGAIFASGAGMGLRGGAAQFNDASVTAGASLDAQLASLQAGRATVQAAGQMTVDAGTGDFTAASSTWKAGQGIALTGGNTTLADSSVAGNGTIAVTGADIDASRASIASPGDVRVVASGTLHIGNATLLAGRDLAATGTGAGTTAGATAMAGRDLELGNGAAFDFAAPDLQYGFNRNLTVRAQGINTQGLTVAAQDLTLDAGGGQLNNQGGSLNASGSLSVSATGLDNRSGVIAANGELTASARSGVLDNASGQIYSTQGAATASGASIHNATGTLSAATDLTLSGGALDNTGNTIAAGRNVTASLSGALTNTGGRIIANTGAVSLTANGIANTHGVIAGTTGATADAGSGTLANTGGQVSGQQVVIGGQVANSAGVLSGLHSVQMTTRAIDNDAGVIEAGAGGITINTAGAALTNTNSGTTRGIVSTGAITIANAGAIDNRSGYIGASDALNITGSASIDNRQGSLLGLGASSVHTAGLLDNRGGSIKGNASLTVGAGTLDNSGAGSVVFANGDLTVTARDHIDNSNTKNGAFTTGLLAAGNLSIAAATVNNANGAIVSLGATSVKATTSLDNTGGQIAGNTVTIDTPALTNTGGRADAQERMSVKVPQFSADGVLASNGALELHLKGDYTNHGTVSSNGELVISTDGTYTNYKDISAKENLYLSAAAVNNGENGVIGSKKTTITATGEVVNEGLINSTSEVTTLNAAGVRNVGRIYGDHINLSAQLVQNGANADGKGAAIASRAGSVAIYGSLVNTGQSLVYSSGSLNVTGAVTNIGSTLDAQGNIEITGQLDNRNAGFATGLQTTSEPASGMWITPAHSTQRYSTAELGWRGDTGGRWVLPSAAYPFSAFGAALLASVTSCSQSDAGDNCTYNYTTSDPVWARFGVGSPDSVPHPGPAPQGNGCVISGDGWDSRDMGGGCGAWWAGVDTHTATVLARYSQLETAIAAFNADLEARSLIDWYETTLTGKTVVKTYVVASDPGIVVAAGDITLRAGNTNQDSRIVAGRNYNGSLPAATYGTLQTTEEGQMVFSHRTWSGGLSQSYGRQVSAPQPIANSPVTQSFKLDITYTPAPYVAETTTALGAGEASVPALGAIAASVRNAGSVHAPTAATHTGTPATQTGGAVTVGTTTTDAPQTALGPGSAGADGAVSALAITPATPATAAQLSAEVNAAPTPILPGSVIAAKVYTDQQQSISTSLASFAVLAAAVPQVAQAVNTSARQAALPPIKDAGHTTVKSSATVRAPNNQLYNVNPGPRGPLVETDPAFTGYRNFLSSAWFLAQLNLDPERTLKLYGDGFAEQRLIDDQIMALTGRRFLSNYTSTEDEYQDLLNAGVMYARQYQLTPGIALSAGQMATLTTDIVWLEARSVTLPDGSTTEALVPTVYLRRPAEGDITPTGSLVSARNITVRSSGDVMNSGTAYAYGDASQGDGRLTIEGQNIGNTGTLAGNAITITAQNNIDNAGGAIQGLGHASTAALNARDIILRTTTQTSVAQIEGPNGLSTGTGTNVDRIATISADSVTMKALGDISLSGAVIRATGELGISATGSITAQAVQTGYTLDVPLGGGGAQGRSSYYSRAETTQQLTTLAGNNVTVTAQGDATFKGTNATAVNDLTVTAKNITLASVKNSLSIDQQGVNTNGFERVAKADETLTGGTFTAGNNVNLTAHAGDVRLTGATIAATNGTATLSASANVVIENGATEHSTRADSFDSNKRILSTHTKTAASSTELIRIEGSSVSGNTISITAGNNATIQASQVNAKDALTIKADNDVIITTAQQLAEAASSAASSKTSTGLGKVIGISSLLTANPLSGAMAGTNKSGAQQAAQSSSTAVGSTLTGASVSVTSGRDTAITGSMVIADNALAITAGRNLAITSAQHTATGDATASSKTSGFLGISKPGIGVLKESQASQDSSTKQAGSTIASLGGNVTLKAGQTYTQTASDVIALKGDVDINAGKVIINQAQNTAQGATQTQHSRTAVGVSVSVPLVDAVRTIARVTEAAGNTDNTRVQALAAATAALNAQAALDSAAQLAAGNLGGVKVTVSLGSSKSESQSTHTSSTAVGSNVLANNITITATGAGEASNIDVTGSNIKAVNATSLKADGQVNLQAATSTAGQHSTNQSSGWSVGAGFAMGGAQNGFTIEASAQQGRGNADGKDTVHTNTQLTGATVNIQSGGDTTLRGAVVTANTVNATIGGNLHIESVQDTSTYDSNQRSSGVGVSLCIPPWCYGMSTVAGGSVSAGKTGVDSNYQSVGEQSGIKAGDGGFNVDVKGDTTLVGGVIATTDKAVGEGKNTFTHGGVVISSDMHNGASFDASGYSITAGVGTSLSSSNAGIGKSEGDANSTTSAGISGVAGNAAVRSTDPSTGIAPIFNAERVVMDINAQITITGAFGPSATKAAGDFANAQFQAAVARGDLQEASLWAPDGSYRAALHAGIGALTGGASGALGAAGTSLTATRVGAAIYELGLPEPIAQGLIQAIVLGGASSVGGSAAGASAFNEATHNTFHLLNLADKVARYGPGAVTAGGLALLTACARSTVCSVALPGAVIALTANRVAETGPSIVDMIPTGGYTPVAPDGGGGTTVSPAAGPVGGNNTTTTPGTVIAPIGTPASGSGGPVAGDNTTVSPAAPGGGGAFIVMNVNGQQQPVVLPSLVDANAATHILYGDGPGSGGHLWPGQPGKSVFPSTWGREKVLSIVSDIATDSNAIRGPPDDRGYISIEASRDGVDVRVIFDTRNGRIVTGYPTNLPRNPR